MVVVAAVVLLALGGGAFAFRHQLKQMVTGGTAAPTPEVTATVTATPSEAVPNEAMSPAASPSVSVSPAVTQSAVEVDLTDNGFSPASVTIKKGETVKFVNKSTGPMGVASNPHPTHTDYPGFDQNKSASQGQKEYDFTFEKVGTWGYHNHLNPSVTGTVVVTS